jgi:hypothetical protein
MLTIVRYLLYVAFVVAAILFWMVVAAVFLDFSMGDPVCLAEGFPCPAPSYWEHGARTLVIFSIVPLTALAFVFYRRAVRRMFGLEEARLD